MENCKNSKKYFGIILGCILINCSVNGMDLAKRTCAFLISMANPVRLLQNQWTYGSYNKAWETSISFIMHQAKSIEASPLSLKIDELDANEEQLARLTKHLDLDTTKIGVTFSESEQIGNGQFHGHTLQQPQLIVPRNPFLTNLDRQDRTILLGQNLVSIKDKALLKIAGLSWIIPYMVNNITPYLMPETNVTPTTQAIIQTFIAIPFAVTILRYIEHYYQKRADTITAQELNAVQESIDTLEKVQELGDLHYRQSNIFKKLYHALGEVLRTAPTVPERIAYLQKLAQQTPQ
jgi:hypothetical protein